MPNVNAPYHYCNKLAWSNVLLLVSRNYWWWLKWLDRMRIRLRSLSIPCYRYRKIVLHTCIKVLHDYATTCRSILLTYIYITLCSSCWVIEWWEAEYIHREISWSSLVAQLLSCRHQWLMNHVDIMIKIHNMQYDSNLFVIEYKTVGVMSVIDTFIWIEKMWTTTARVG